MTKNIHIRYKQGIVSYSNNSNNTLLLDNSIDKLRLDKYNDKSGITA